jgi:6-phosphogluconolactonase (cycloisomerase 2 family)
MPSSGTTSLSSGGASNSGSGTTNSGGSGGNGSTTGSGTPSSTPAALGFLYVGLDDAYSYYGNIPHTGHASIAGFSLAADGSLQSTPGSPYTGPAAALASNPSESAVYAASGSTLNVDRINGDGSLSTTSSLTAQPLSPSVGIYESLSFDVSAQLLYAVANHGAGTEFFEIYKTGGDGSLTSSGNQQGTVSTYPLSFTADGKLAYEQFCYHLDSEIFGLRVGSDGQLASFNSNAPIPTLDAQYPSCPHALALSPDNKFVAAPLNSVTTQAAALALWTINSDETLTAVSGSPYPRSAQASDIAWDASGRYIALAAKDGLWVYSFVAGSPPVPVGGAAIVAGPIDHVVFNKAGTLLMATSASSQSLYVFSVNASTGAVTPAPGSPHNLGVAPYQLVMAER